MRHDIGIVGGEVRNELVLSLGVVEAADLLARSLFHECFGVVERTKPTRGSRIGGKNRQELSRAHASFVTSLPLRTSARM